MSELTLPRVLASGPALHLRARVELTNGTILVGHITEMDADTMNLTMDGFTQTAVRRTVQMANNSKEGTSNTTTQQLSTSHNEGEAEQRTRIEEPDPVALRCMRSIVIRGACIRYLDLAPDDPTDGGDLDDLLEAVKEAIPSFTLMGCSNEKERPQQIAYQRDFLGACWDGLEGDEATIYRHSRWLGVSKQVMQRATRHHCFLIRAYRLVDDKSPAERMGDRVRTLDGGGGGGASFASMNGNGSYSYAGSADMSMQRPWLGPNSPRPGQSASAGYLSPTSHAARNGSFSMGSPSMYSRTHQMPPHPPSLHQTASMHSGAGGGTERQKKYNRSSRMWSGGLRRGETIQQQVRDTNHLERLMHNQHAYLRVNGLSVHQGVIFRAAPARRHYSHIALLLAEASQTPSAAEENNNNNNGCRNANHTPPPPLVNSYAIEDYDVPTLRASTPPVIVGSISPQELLSLSTNAEVCLGGWLYVSLEDERKRLRHALNGYLAHYIRLTELDRKEQEEALGRHNNSRNHNNSSSEPIVQSADASPGVPSPLRGRSRDNVLNHDEGTPNMNSAPRRQRSTSRLNKRRKEMMAWLPSGYLIIALPMYECAILPTAYHLEINGCRPISLNLQDAQSRRSFGTGCITGVRYGGVILLECRDRVTLRELQWVRSLVALYDPRRCVGVPTRGPILAPMPYNLWSLKRSIVRELANEGMYVVVAHTRPHTTQQQQQQTTVQAGGNNANDVEPTCEVDGAGNVLPQGSSATYGNNNNDSNIAGDDSNDNGPHSPYASRKSDDSGITAGAVGPEENEVRGTFRQLGGMKCMDAGRLRYGCAASYVALNVVKWLRSLLQWPIKARPLSIFLQRYEGMANVLLESSMELAVKGQLGNAAAATLGGGSFANYNVNSFVLQQGSPTFSAATMPVMMEGHGNGMMISNGRMVFNANAAGVAPVASPVPRAATLGNSFASPFDTYPGSSPNVNSTHDNAVVGGGGNEAVVANRNRLAAAGVIFPFNTYYTGPLEPDLRALLSPAVEKLIALQHQPAQSPVTPPVKKPMLPSPPQQQPLLVPATTTAVGSNGAKRDGLMPLVLTTDNVNGNSGTTLLTTPIVAGQGAVRLLPRVGSAATLERAKTATTLNLFTLNSMVNNQAYMDVDALPNTTTAATPTGNGEMMDSFAPLLPTTPSLVPPSARQPTALQLRLQQVASFTRAGGFVPRLLTPVPPPSITPPQAELTPKWYETDRTLRALKADLEEIQFLLTNARTEWLRLESEFYRIGALFLPHTRVDNFVLAPLFIKTLRQFPEDVPVKELHADWLPVLVTLITVPHAHLFCRTGTTTITTQSGRRVDSAPSDDDAFAGKPYTHFVSAEERTDTALCQALTESLETNYYISEPCPNFAPPRLLHELTLATPPPHLTADHLIGSSSGSGGGSGASHDGLIARRSGGGGSHAALGGFGGAAAIRDANASLTGQEAYAEGQLSFRFTGGSLGVLAGLFHYYTDCLERRYEAEAAKLQQRLLTTHSSTNEAATASLDPLGGIRTSGDLLQREHNVFLRRIWIWGAAQGTRRSAVMRHTLRAIMHAMRRNANSDNDDDDDENRHSGDEPASSSVLHEALEHDAAAMSEAAASGATSHTARHPRRNSHASLRHHRRHHRRTHKLRPLTACTQGVAVKLSTALEGNAAVRRERLQRSGIPFRSSEAFALFDAIAHYLRCYETLQRRFVETFGHLLPSSSTALSADNELLVSSFELCVSADHFYKLNLQTVNASTIAGPLSTTSSSLGKQQQRKVHAAGCECDGTATSGVSPVITEKTTSAGGEQGGINNMNGSGLQYNENGEVAMAAKYMPRTSRFGARKPTGNHLRDRKQPLTPREAEQPYCGGEEVRQKWSIKESRRLYSFLRDSLQRWRGGHGVEAGTSAFGKHITVTMV